MRMTRAMVTTSCLAWAIAGCAGVPTLRPDAAPDPRFGYVGVVLAEGAAGFLLEDAAGRKYVLPHEPEPLSGKKGVVRSVLIAVPPGEYRIAKWGSKQLSWASELARPLPVQAGRVLILGKFGGHTECVREGRWLKCTSQFWSEHLPADDALKRLRATYPAFRDVPVECLACGAPSPGAVEAAEPVSAPLGEFSRGRSVVLHYHRPNGKYAGWGLHVWEEVPGAQPRLLEGVSWAKPLPPSGADDFGVYWELNEVDFRAGRVGFQPHGGEIRDAPRTWLLEHGREAWVVDGDPTAYPTKEDALAALPK